MSKESPNENEFFGIDLTPFLNDKPAVENKTTEKKSPSSVPKKRNLSSSAKDPVDFSSSRVRSNLMFPTDFARKLKYLCYCRNMKPADLIVSLCSDRVDDLFKKEVVSFSEK